MVTPWTLLTMSEAGFILACYAFLAGCACGAAIVACFGWRRLTRPADDRYRVRR
jgi:hypothetical protein